MKLNLIKPTGMYKCTLYKSVLILPQIFNQNQKEIYWEQMTLFLQQTNYKGKKKSEKINRPQFLNYTNQMQCVNLSELQQTVKEIMRMGKYIHRLGILQKDYWSFTCYFKTSCISRVFQMK